MGYYYNYNFLKDKYRGYIPCFKSKTNVEYTSNISRTKDQFAQIFDFGSELLNYFHYADSSGNLLPSYSSGSVIFTAMNGNTIRLYSYGDLRGFKFYLANNTEVSSLVFNPNTNIQFMYPMFGKSASDGILRLNGWSFRGKNTDTFRVFASSNFDNYNFSNFFGDSIVELNGPYDTLPDSEPDGGFGGTDYSNDDTDYSGLPTLSSSRVGFCSLYKMTEQQMKDLADYLWGLSTGTIATFLPVFSNPMDCIIAVGIVPVDPEVESQDDLIKVGNLTTTVWARRITKQYDEIDMGEVEVGKGKFTNSFMDYSPYTKVELYLPYIGNVSLDTDEVMDSTIGVKYKFDLLSGSCVAEVKITKTYNYQDEDHVHSNILYRYSGNFLANIPINGENFSQMFNAVIGAVAMGINAAGNYKTGIASADMAKNADVSSARSDAASLHRSAAAFNGVGATSAMKPSIQRAGNVSSVCGFLSKQKPEIILKLPKVASIGENQGHEVGYPRYGEYTIAELEGYSSIMMVHLKNIPCTDIERNMIENDLNAGVIFSKTAVPQHSEFQNIVKVYKFKCENICVNKADNWELIDTLTIAWRNPNIDVLNPTIRIEATSNLTKRRILREGNYVYIADFERYYYVKSMKAQAGNFIELELSVDACMSWLTNLRNQQCVVDRQEKVWNTYLNDEFMRVYNTPYTVVKEFPNGFSTQNFVLAVAGGGSSSSSS